MTIENNKGEGDQIKNDLIEAARRVIHEYRSFDLTIGAIEDLEGAVMAADSIPF